MKRNPETGDAIKLNKKDVIVVNAYERIDESYDGNYYAYVFETVPYAEGIIEKPKITEWSLTNWRFQVGKTVNLIDIDHEGRVGVTVTNTEVITNAKTYGRKPKISKSTVIMIGV